MLAVEVAVETVEVVVVVVGGGGVVVGAEVVVEEAVVVSSVVVSGKVVKSVVVVVVVVGGAGVDLRPSISSSKSRILALKVKSMTTTATMKQVRAKTRNPMTRRRIFSSLER